MKKILKNEWPLHVMMLPALIILLVYSYLPMVGIVIAFQDFVPSGGLGQFFKSEWVGLDNFTYIFGMEDTYRVLANTVVIALMKIIAGIIVPLVLALMLNEVRSTFFKRTTQTIVYIPFFLSWVILGGILIDLLSPTDGFVNQIIMAFGHKPVYFLGDLHTIQGVLVASNIWKEVGYNMVIFLAALTGIDQSQYEAAKVDGAGHLKQLLYITLPNILPMIILLTVLSMGNILNAGFDQIFNLYSPVVYDKADIIDTFVYRIGMQQLQYSMATAMGVFKSLVSLVFVSASFYLAKKFANYQLF
ncbi:MAG TPA: ABC transporter permease subunit [Mobilitalea sp.]|nr:ABC transporter permease subunit [Mobilitalea sp.]